MCRGSRIWEARPLTNKRLDVLSWLNPGKWKSQVCEVWCLIAPQLQKNPKKSICVLTWGKTKLPIPFSELPSLHYNQSISRVSNTAELHCIAGILARRHPWTSPEIIRKVLHSWGFKRWHGLADRWLSSRVCLGRGRWSEPAPQPRQGGDGSRTCCWPVLGAGGWVGWWQLWGTPWDWNKRNESGELAVLKGFHGENAAKGDKPYLNCLSHTPILHLSTTLESIALKSGVTGLSPEITKVATGPV